MRRPIALFAVLALLLSVFAPAMQALSAPALHACCLRKMHSRDPHQAAFQAPSCCQPDCCKSPTVPQVAQVSTAFSFVGDSAQRYREAVHLQFRAFALDTSHSGRAPPPVLSYC